MSQELILGLLPVVGTFIGTLVGILVTNKLTLYRVEQLEKKVDRHNSLAEKIPILEHRISELEVI